MSENDNKKEEALLQDSCQRRKHRCNEFKKKYAILVMVWYTILLNNGYGIQKNITDNGRYLKMAIDKILRCHNNSKFA